jgi:iron complex transport system ATP-binding protein
MSLLEGRGLSLSLGGNRILSQVDLDLEAGEMLGLIGPNGAGKSSLLKLLAGLIPSEAGTVRLAGRMLQEFSPAQRAKRISWLAQRAEVNWPVSVETLIELGRAPHLQPWEQASERDCEIIESTLERTELNTLRQRPCNTLSGGELARVLLARALATRSEILLADEPVAALDLAHQLDMMSLLADYCRQGHSVILVLHDLPLAAHFCNRLQLLHQGQTLAVGNASEVLNARNLETAYQVRHTGTVDPDSFNIPWQRVR